MLGCCRLQVRHKAIAPHCSARTTAAAAAHTHPRAHLIPLSLSPCIPLSHMLHWFGSPCFGFGAAASKTQGSTCTHSTFAAPPMLTADPACGDPSSSTAWQCSLGATSPFARQRTALMPTPTSPLAALATAKYTEPPQPPQLPMAAQQSDLRPLCPSGLFATLWRRCWESACPACRWRTQTTLLQAESSCCTAKWCQTQPIPSCRFGVVRQTKAQRETPPLTWVLFRYYWVAVCVQLPHRPCVRTGDGASNHVPHCL